MNGGALPGGGVRGDAVRALGMQERMTLANMSAELGAQVGLVAPDETTRAWLHGRRGARRRRHRALAHRCRRRGRRATGSTPPRWRRRWRAAQPGQRAAGRRARRARRSTVAYIGACTGAKLDDLRAAASVLRGRRVAPGVQPAGGAGQPARPQQAARRGRAARCSRPAPSCCPTPAAPAPATAARIPDGATVISTTARNFKGRMGSATAQVYLASPYTVAASALRGRIADPREIDCMSVRPPLPDIASGACPPTSTPTRSRPARR